MRRPWNGAMPVLLTLPLRIEARRRVRERRRRRLAVGFLLALGLALLAAGFWVPAKAELGAPLAVDGVTVIAGHRDTHFRSLATLALGDELARAVPLKFRSTGAGITGLKTPTMRATT